MTNRGLHMPFHKRTTSTEERRTHSKGLQANEVKTPQYHGEKSDTWRTESLPRKINIYAIPHQSPPSATAGIGRKNKKEWKSQTQILRTTTNGTLASEPSPRGTNQRPHLLNPRIKPASFQLENTIPTSGVHCPITNVSYSSPLQPPHARPPRPKPTGA